MPTKVEELKKLLKSFLDNKDYENFIREITKLEVTDENYINYLDLINEVLSDKMKVENPFDVTSGKKLLRAFGATTDEETIFEKLEKIKEAVVEIFTRKLKIRRSRTFSDDERNAEIKTELDRFEGRFM